MAKNSTRLSPNSVRLRHVRDDGPGFSRERTRSGFRYRDTEGRTIRSRKVLDRIRRLAIPPAWKRVWICPHANGHVQATGRDARGRKQYRYHALWVSARGKQKYSRLREFGTALTGVRKRIRADLNRSGLPIEKVLAAVVQLLDGTHLRIGNPEYNRANGTFGLSTMLDRHVRFSGGGMKVRFRGKGGVWHERRVSDRTLARTVRRCRDLPGQDLFQYFDSQERIRTVTSTDVNGYIREAAGGDFTAKDFRTWAGTVVATAALSARPVPPTPRAGDKGLIEVVRTVAADLGNTPAVCRKCYVHPVVMQTFRTGKWPKVTRRPHLSADESRLLSLLNGAGTGVGS